MARAGRGFPARRHLRHAIKAQTGGSTTGVVAASSSAAPAGTVSAGSAPVTLTGVTAPTVAVAPPGFVFAPIAGNVQVLVQADFTGTPFGGTPTWTDITGFVDSGSISGTWGRQSEQGDVTSGSCTIPLDNVDGRFTPSLVASPYYPFIRPGVRVQVQVSVTSDGGVYGEALYGETIPGSTVYLFDGYATSWVATFDNGVYGVCELSCSDILTRFLNDNSLLSFAAEEILFDSPSSLYMFQEDEDSVSFGDVTGQLPPAVALPSQLGSGVVTGGVAAVGAFTAGTMVDLLNTAYTTVGSGAPTAGTYLDVPCRLTAPFTLEVWVQPTTTVPLATCYILDTTGTQNQGVSLELNTSGNLTANIHQGLTTQILTDTVNLCDGQAHHIALTLAADNQTVRLYRDGVNVISASGTVFTVVDSGADMILGGVVVGGVLQQCFSGQFAYLATFPSELPAARIGQHYRAATTGFPDGTLVRIERLAAYRTTTGVNTGGTWSGAMGLQDITSESFGQAFLDCGDVEGTVVYVDGQGVIQLVPRSQLFNPVPALTLDAGNSQVDVPTDFTNDTQNTINDLTISRPGGADQRVFNQTSIAQVGTFQTSITVPADTDQNALNLANWQLAAGVQDQTSSRSLTVTNLRTEPDLTPFINCLRVKPLDVVTLVNLPAAAPSSPVSYQVQGGTWALSIDEVTLTWYTAQLPPVTAIWDAGVWDSNAVWAF